MIIKRFIRPKDGDWREIIDQDWGVVKQSFDGESDDQLSARMAQHYGIEGDFEIEVRYYRYSPKVFMVAPNRSVTGTTAVLTTTK